ncbi:proline dehydrogenase family protein [Gordonia sp. DT218]|uniref:proline dehydrogenase family protein n=1 Tax=Gordonia sp. DT218 TaxID=3416659 RepID=UPI003CF94F61
MSKFFDTTMRPMITAVAASERIKETSQRLTVTRRVVERFVPGETEEDVLAAIRDSLGNGLSVTIDHLGEDTSDDAQAARTVDAYLSLLEEMSRMSPPTPNALEVSVKLTALGQMLPRHGRKIAEENVHTICAAAEAAGVLVTVDAEDHATVDGRLDIVRTVRRDLPSLGTVLQAYLRRTEDDCREFAESGARIRLCKGAYAEPPTVAFADRTQIDEAFLRCLRILMKGNGHPMVASHDPMMIGAAHELAAEFGRAPDSWEHQMLYGIRTDEQLRLAGDGHRVRVYIPYGREWYGYFVRRLAERPANVTFFLRALADRRHPVTAAEPA